MPRQKLYLEGGTLEVDRIFRDGDITIAQVGDRFIYMNGKPVENPDHLKIVPDHFKVRSATPKTDEGKAESKANFVCDYPGCGKGFYIKVALVGHKRVHKASAVPAGV